MCSRSLEIKIAEIDKALGAVSGVGYSENRETDSIKSDPIKRNKL